MSKITKIRIGTRKSALALKQAQEVRLKLVSAWPKLGEQGMLDIISMQTSGDQIQDKRLTDFGGKGMFTKEIEEALLSGAIDMAVHSMKDMLTELPAGLTIGAMLKREDPRDMLVGQGIHSVKDIPQGATFGTSSLRREAQIRMLRPDLHMVNMRGNVQTRLHKIERGELRTTMLARAGINRLNLAAVPGVVLSLDECLPAVGQGAIGIECRKNDALALGLLKPLSHLPTEQAVTCERAFLRVLDGNCHTPIAGHAAVVGDQLQFRGLIAKQDGSAHHLVEIKGAAQDAEKLGLEAGQQLLQKAGKDFLKT
jgi:hydroxymethylbilane synthase